MKKSSFIPVCLLALFGISSCSTKVTTQENPALSMIHNRKSVRSYTSQPVERKDLQILIEAGFAAPSGRDLRPWEIVVIDNREALDTLAKALPYAKMLAEAQAAIVVCGDTTKSSLWVYDCSAMTQNILLAAEAMGLGAVWTAAHPYPDRMNAIAQCVNLPENVLPLALIPIGHPKGETAPKKKYNESQVHFNKW